MSLITKKSKLVKNTEELSGNKRDIRKKIIKSNTKQSDLKRPITKRSQGGLASFIEVEDHPTTITPTEFSEYSFPLSNTYIDIKQKDQPIEFEEENTISSKYIPLSNETPQLGDNSFDKILNEVSSNNPSVKNLRKFLTETARAESNFDFNVQNKAGAPAYGAFQFMDFNIKPLGVSVEQFRNNPKLQIEAAANLANQFKSQFTEEDRKLAKEKGYNENALLAGAWLGGIGGVRKVLRGQGNPSDKHWSKEGKGITVKDRMDKFNKMKEGGVLKYGGGKKVSNYGKRLSTWDFIKGKSFDIGATGILSSLGILNMEDTPEYRRQLLYNRHNPSGNEFTAVVDYIGNASKVRGKNISGTPEEEAFYANYLGLPQDLVKATNYRRPDGKDNSLKNAEFVTTTPSMDLRIQGMADTLNLGKLSRMSPSNYKKLQEQHPTLLEQKEIVNSYKFSKDLLDHPNVPKQAHEDLSPKKQRSSDGTNLTGLGALRYFGMQWDDKNQKLYGWDTYNFDWWQRLLGNMPDRKNSLEIRTVIPFNPKQGSKLLRDI